jgi:hypothetical protein
VSLLGEPTRQAYLVLCMLQPRHEYGYM